MDLVVAVLVLAALVCGRFGFSVWPFWPDLWPFWLWPFWFVAVLDAILNRENNTILAARIVTTWIVGLL